MIPAYAQMSFTTQRATGCDIVTADGRHILDFYGGHAVAALGYAHPRLTRAISEQAQQLRIQTQQL